MSTTTIGVRRGRSVTDLFIATPVWITLAAISPGAKSLYSILQAHVNVARGDGVAYPSQQTLADMLGKSQPTVSRFLQELLDVGAIEAQRARRNGANVYLVHEVAPDGYTGPVTLQQYYKHGVRASPPASRRCANPTVTSGYSPVNEAVDIHQQICGDSPANIHTSTGESELDGVEEEQQNHPLTPAAPDAADAVAPDDPPARRCRHRRTSCRVCGTSPRALARRAAQAARAARKASWCGRCDEHTRQLLDDQERPYRCPVCHPLVAGDRRRPAAAAA